MGKLSLNSILLFVLVIPFIMGYRIGTDETPYYLFGIIFFELLLYIILDLLHLPEKRYFLLKRLLLLFIVISVIGSAFSSAIIVRHKTAPIYMIHDIILQQEAAIRFVLDGKNPYKETYFGTPLEEWHYSDTEVNPALYHFVMQPAYLVIPLPFYFMSNIVLGYFDARIPLLFLFFVMICVAALAVKEKEKQLEFVILLAFNPAMLAYTLEGRSDVFMYAFMIVGFYFLTRYRYTLSGVALGIAFAIKQSAWPLFPLYAMYLLFKRKSFKKMVISLAPLVITSLIFIVPFYLWDQKAFVTSTVSYLSGNTEHSYPISGYGLGSMLVQFHVIKDAHSYYPFMIWQLLLCVPLLVILSLYIRKSPHVKRLILCYGIFLFVYWYLSRYFNNSHLGFLSMVFITGYFWENKEED